MTEDEKRIKRKSNAFMAAEAVQQEMSAVKALKRLSIGTSSISIDPDLPFAVDGDFNFNDYSSLTRNRSRSSSDSSDLSDEDQTLINDQQQQQNDEFKKLLWVPAKKHPNIAPERFKKHVELTLNDLQNKYDSEHEGSGKAKSLTSSLNKKLSKKTIPSLKELTDELDKLSEIAGLAANDAVTLARSLSSASMKSGLSLGSSSREHSGQDAVSDLDLDSSLKLDSEDSDDKPIISDNTPTLTRNKWGTYSRNNRGERLKKTSPVITESYKFQTQNSPLPDELHKENRLPATTEEPVAGPVSRPELRKTSSQQEIVVPERKSRGASRNVQHKSWDWNRNEIKDQSKIKHARNRHVGPLVVGQDGAPQASLPTAEPQSQPQTQPQTQSQTQPQPQTQPQTLAESQPEAKEKKPKDGFLKMFNKIKKQKDNKAKPVVSNAVKTSSFHDQVVKESKNYPNDLAAASSSSASQAPAAVDEKPLQLQSSPNIIPKRQQQQQQHHNRHQKQKQHPHHGQYQQQPQQQLGTPATSSPQPQQTTDAQREILKKKLSMESLNKSTKPNAPIAFTDSAFGFPLPPISSSTIVMIDHRLPIHVERALYRLSHLKLANPRRELRQQVLLSNFMYSYLNLVNHTLYLQEMDEANNELEYELT